MKKFYLIATAVTMLTACTNSEKMTADFSNDGPVMIGFETFHEKSTKAAATGEISNPSDFDLDNDGNGGFGVWGFKGAPADIPASSDESNYTLNVNNATTFVPIFENVQVWYVNADNATYKPKGFTYKVPKYWDKKAEYIFFAYAPYNSGKTKDDQNNDVDVVSLDKTTGKITVRDIESIQDMSKFTGDGEARQYSGTGTVQSSDSKIYQAADATGVIDYLMAKYETEQKYTGTNQDTKNDWSDYTSNPDLRDQTVGFTFGHMLSRIVINLQAADLYSGVKYISVSYLAIKNMPEVKTDKTVFTQTSPTAAAGTYTPNTWSGKTLQIINNNNTSDANANATSKVPLYILKNGAGKTAENGDVTTNADLINYIVPPTRQPQSFYYYIAPNAPSGESGEKKDHYYLNINYTIKYIDNVEENVVIENVDLNEKLASMLQNYSYKLNIKVGLNQIYFTVDQVKGWNEQTAQTIEIK